MLRNKRLRGARTPLSPSNQVATPTFGTAPGTFAQNQTTTAACSTSGASIYYTVGTSASPPSDPTVLDTLYSSAIPITTSPDTVIKLKAFKSGMTDSAVATATYTISRPTGGTITYDGAYTVMEVTASGNVVVQAGTTLTDVQYLLRDGGAGGGNQGGGGGGGLSQAGTFATMPAGTYPAIIGAGGSGGAGSSGWGGQGNPSSFNGLSGDATGAGGGGRYDQAGKNGGPTGGGGGSGGGGPFAGGTGTLHNGGQSLPNGPAGGGAGYGANGSDGAANQGGAGGAGLTSSISGASVGYCGGGGGGGGQPTGTGNGGAGADGGGNGGTGESGYPTVSPTPGAANRGGGGGGSFGYYGGESGANGGSGGLTLRFLT